MVCSSTRQLYNSGMVQDSCDLAQDSACITVVCAAHGSPEPSYPMHPCGGAGDTAALEGVAQGVQAVEAKMPRTVRAKVPHATVVQDAPHCEGQGDTMDAPDVNPQLPCNSGAEGAQSRPLLALRVQPSFCPQEGCSLSRDSWGCMGMHWDAWGCMRMHVGMHGDA